MRAQAEVFVPLLDTVLEYLAPKAGSTADVEQSVHPLERVEFRRCLLDPCCAEVLAEPTAMLSLLEPTPLTYPRGRFSGKVAVRKDCLQLPPLHCRDAQLRVVGITSQIIS